MKRQPFAMRPSVRRSTELGVTALFWLAWIYLISPLLSLLLWLVGIQLFTDEMLARGGYRALLRELGDYGLVISLMLLAISSWIEWNQRRYGRNNKRTLPPQSVGDKETAVRAGMTLAALEHLQAAKQAVVDFDDSDRLRLCYRSAKSDSGP